MVSHQKIASFSFGVATKTSYAMLPGIIGNRHRQVHLATFGRETNLFDEAVLHDPGGPEHSKPAAYPPPRLRIEEVSIVGGVIPRTPQNRRRDD
ncbi:hypothetical protein I543_4629 [Mycobacteroides abscessus 21]|uniref:Uncharacterized protein n=1 Tax=Mycobacteroides abscessus 21 TaxID=1299324 RepID=A0A829Q162_9MYCO|nr:hypothetical protein I543_4629 [Mycobacteroides abscessus 21]